MTLNNIQGKILKLMAEKNFSQTDLAKKSKLAESTISDLVHGKKFPTYLSMCKIARAFSMDIVEFLTYTSGSDSHILIEHLLDSENWELMEWIKDSKNLPYLKYIHNVSKEIPVGLLGKLRFLIESNFDGGNS
jgi:transcriptional regulator with XRE-family HTH domain